LIITTLAEGTVVSAVNVSVTIPSHGVIVYEAADLHRVDQAIPDLADVACNSARETLLLLE